MMPLYHNLTTARRRRLLHRWHVFVLAEFVLALKKESYGKRGELPRTVHELKGEDLTDDLVLTWALVREELAHDIVDDFNDRHRKPLPRKSGVIACGRMAPSLYGILTKVLRENDFIETGKMYAPTAACLRARRDLEAVVGMRVAACRAKLGLDQVFAPAS